MKYRSRTDITAEILKTALNGAVKTKIMYQAFLSYVQLKEYLAVLEEQKLLEYRIIEQQYYTTEKGRCFLKIHEDIDKMMVSVNSNSK